MTEWTADGFATAQRSHEDDEPVRTAVVGLGYWGPNLARNLQELPAAQLVAMCDPREEALQAVGIRYPQARLSRDFEEILDDADIEAVVVATPVSTHYALATAALEAKKHVFVEKPLAASSTEALDLIERARSYGLTLMPGHTFLYSPPVNMVRDLINSGELGDIHFISTSRVNLGLHQADVSVTWDLAPHDFSILRYWLGELPAQVMALSKGCVLPNVADVAFINLCFPAGTIVHVEIAWLAPSKLRRTAVVGSLKMIVYDDMSPEPVRVFDAGVLPRDPATFGEYQLTYRTGDIVSPHVDVAEPLALEMFDFCSAIRTGSEPRSSAEIGLDVIRMIEAVHTSLSAGGVPSQLGDPSGSYRE
jgi:predicted dehydrogenase